LGSVLIAASAFVAFILAYIFYGTFISKRIFSLGQLDRCPSEELADGHDYVATKRHILFGHHFTSIAGAAPILGPAIAVIWGWLPALLWIVFGSIFIGAVHDLGALVVSARSKGRSIGDVSKGLIGSRARTLFLFIIFFLVWVVLAVFAMIIAALFNMYPASIFPIWFEIPLALWLGYMLYRRKGNAVLWSVIAVLLMYASIYVGTLFPVQLSDPVFQFGSFAVSPLVFWIGVLFVYAYVASTLPVHRLLQPRDYINSHELYIGLAVIFVGLVVARPAIVAPAVNSAPVGAPSLIPFLFVVVACGAISGFHSLVASGTTSKQLARESDAKAIGYGSMLLEGALATVALVAVAAGVGLGLKHGGEMLTGTAAWSAQYANWGAAQGLGAKVGAFVEGAANLITALGIPRDLAATIVAVVLVSFAGTTLDTATRIQRYVVSELGQACKVPFLSRTHPATLVAVVSAAVLAFSQQGGKGGLRLWPLFGTTNQLLAGLALVTLTLYLAKRGKPIVYTLVPMLFVIAFTGWAMIGNLTGFIAKDNWFLSAVSGVILALELWLIVEAVRAYTRFRASPTPESTMEAGE